MAWSLKGLRDRAALPAKVAAAISIGPRERLLAWARAEERGSVVVASNHRLYAVSGAGELTLAEPWHEVDAAVWEPDSRMLTLTWVAERPPAQWLFQEPTLLLETVRERVQASVVLAETVVLESRRSARVVIRQDLATGSLLEQVIPGKGVRTSDAGVRAHVEPALAHLREQVGLD